MLGFTGAGIGDGQSLVLGITGFRSLPWLQWITLTGFGTIVGIILADVLVLQTIPG